MGWGIDPSFEEKKTNAKVCAIDVSKEFGERVEVGFNRHERVKGTLSEETILFEGGAEEMGERSRVRGGGRRDAMKKGTRMGSFPNPDGSERKRARPIRVSMVAEEGLT